MADTNQVATISATPDLEIIEGQITTTSQQIAEHFGKRHADVIRAIRKLEAPAEFTERNFALSEFTDSTGRKLPIYRITRDGFTLLAMGFTGKEAMQWKVAYLAAFNKMESELLAKTTRPANPAIDYDRISPSQKRALQDLVEDIVGRNIQTYGETWGRLCKKFRVNSYHELPASRFEEARDYLLGKLPEQPTPIPDAERLSLAFSVAAAAGAQVQRTVFEQLAKGMTPETIHARTMAAVTFDRDGNPTTPWARAMQPREFITTADTLPKMISNSDLLLSDVQVSQIISACANVLSKRAVSRIAA